MDNTFMAENPVGGPGFPIAENNTEIEFSLESPKKVKQLGKYHFIDEAVHVLREQGLDVDAHTLDLTGKLTRCAVIGKLKGTKDGAYKVHTDEPACLWYKNYISGDSGTWRFSTKSTSQTMTDQERQALHERIETNKKKRLDEEVEKHAHAAKLASDLYNDGCSDPSQTNQHAYATSKQVPFGPEVRRGVWPQRDWQDALLIPAFDENRTLVSLQAIDNNGAKDFLTGGKVSGSFCPIGPSFLTAEKICIVEGYATGAAVNDATGLPVIVAFDAGNLLKVGQMLRRLCPEAELIFCADDDSKPDNDRNTGIEAATRAANATEGKMAEPGMGGKADFQDAWREYGPEAVRHAIANAGSICSVEEEAGSDYDSNDDEDQVLDSDLEQTPIKVLFPRTSFPWQVLPHFLELSFQQLARSCASSALPLPGFAVCLISAAVGRKFSVSPKASWEEPLIIWLGDIRESGAGKSPMLKMFSSLFVKMQLEETAEAELREKDYTKLSAEDRREMDPPKRARRYRVTNYTVEGVHAELADHPTGGMIVVLDELSTMLNSQGEYKNGNGTDREALLTLHDGSSASITRKTKTIDIPPSRLQVCGGIQPQIFAKLFSQKSGTYLVDGTIFRFLLTYESISYFPLTTEVWSEENRSAWEQTLRNAFEWADTSEPLKACLSPEAQERFISWRNEIGKQVPTLPAIFRGFIPKAWGYALRLAGALHLLDRFSQGLKPSPILSFKDMERGIVATEFFLGQAFDAIRLIVSPEHAEPTEISMESFVLARALDELRSEIDKGKLAVGFITEKFNELAKEDGDHLEARKVGGLLRKCGLPPAAGKHDANDRKRVRCLQWSNAVEEFIKTSLASQTREYEHQSRLNALGDVTDPNLPPQFAANNNERSAYSANEFAPTPVKSHTPSRLDFPDKWDPSAIVQAPDRTREARRLDESMKTLPFDHSSDYRQ